MRTRGTREGPGAVVGAYLSSAADPLRYLRTYIDLQGQREVIAGARRLRGHSLDTLSMARRGPAGLPGISGRRGRSGVTNGRARRLPTPGTKQTEPVTRAGDPAAAAGIRAAWCDTAPRGVERSGATQSPLPPCPNLCSQSPHLIPRSSVASHPPSSASVTHVSPSAVTFTPLLWHPSFPTLCCGSRHSLPPLSQRRGVSRSYLFNSSAGTVTSPSALLSPSPLPSSDTISLQTVPGPFLSPPSSPNRPQTSFLYSDHCHSLTTNPHSNLTTPTGLFFHCPRSLPPSTF